MSLKSQFSKRRDSIQHSPPEKTETSQTEEQTHRADAAQFEPMPLQHFPPVMRDYVNSVSQAVGCDPSFVALPLLAVCAGVIGNARRLRVKRGWFVPPIIWSALIGESGTQKSPPLRAVIRPLKTRQQRQIEEHGRDVSDYKSAVAEYKLAMKSFKQTGEGTPPAEPRPPICSRCSVSDTTIEGLVPILSDNWRGVVLQRDELVGWIGGFDKYSKAGTASTDAAHWLSIYNADSIVVDRKTGEPRTLFVPDPSVTVVGTIQPGVLNRVLSDEHRENGLAARLLMVYPPRRIKRWTDAEIPESQETALEDLIDRLSALSPDLDSQGDNKPGIVFLTEPARLAFIDYYNQTGEEQSGMSGDLAAAWSKREETAARIALVFHCVRQVTTGDVEEWKCDGDSMQAAIVLAEWFKNETQRIQTLLCESSEERKLRQLAEWIRFRGGTVRARDVARGRRDTPSTEAAELKLLALVNAGFGEWRTIDSTMSGG
jgi:hypothetical protein